MRLEGRQPRRTAAVEPQSHRTEPEQIATVSAEEAVAHLKNVLTAGNIPAIEAYFREYAVPVEALEDPGVGIAFDELLTGLIQARESTANNQQIRDAIDMLTSRFNTKQ